MKKGTFNWGALGAGVILFLAVLLGVKTSLLFMAWVGATGG